MRSLSLMSVLFVTVSTAALASPVKTPLSMADWHVAPRAAANNAASYCAMSARYPKGPIVTFTRNATHKGTIAVDFRSADLEKGKQYAVTLRFGSEQVTYRAPAIGKATVLLNIGSNEILTNALADGKDITVSLDGTPGIYTLAGNKRAFFELEHCVKALAPQTPTAYETVMTAPAAPIEKVEAEPLPQALPRQVILEEEAPKQYIPVAMKMVEPMQMPAPAPIPMPPPAKLEIAKTEPAAGVERVDMQSILWDVIPQETIRTTSTTPAFEPAPEIVEAAPIPVVPTQNDETRLKEALDKAREKAMKDAALPTPVARKDIARVKAPETFDAPSAKTPVTVQAAQGVPAIPVTMEEPKKKSIQKYKLLPPADVEITPIAPKSAPKGKTMLVKPEGFGGKQMMLEDEIRELPPALPPSLKPTLSVSADPAGKYDAVVPSTGHPAQKAAPKAAFRPAPVPSSGNWKTRKIDSKSGQPEKNFCLTENQYDNDTLLMIGQRADGHSTIGVNYGIDMLQKDREYKVTVRIDEAFEESFTGYAENPQTLVVQMGKKQSFFQTLQTAKALRVTLPGSASTFKTDNIAGALQDLSNCIVGIGGEKLTVEKAAIQIEEIPVAQETLPAPAPIVAAIPTPTAMPVPASMAAPAPISWAAETRAFLFTLGLADKPKQDTSEARIVWKQADVDAEARNLGKTDLLDAATNALDAEEKSCRGEYSSQIGLPEGNVVLMESKCFQNGTAFVTTWLAESRDGVVTVWRFTADRDQRTEAFRQRDLVQQALQGDHNS